MYIFVNGAKVSPSDDTAVAALATLMPSTYKEPEVGRPRFNV